METAQYNISGTKYRCHRSSVDLVDYLRSRYSQKLLEERGWNRNRHKRSARKLCCTLAFSSISSIIFQNIDVIEYQFFRN